MNQKFRQLQVYDIDRLKFQRVCRIEGVNQVDAFNRLVNSNFLRKIIKRGKGDK